MRFARIGLLLLVWTLPTAARAQDIGAIKASFVVLGPNGTATARVLTAAPSCPNLVIDGASHAMGIRALPETLPLRTTALLPVDSKPAAFPVLVCEFALPKNPGSVMLGDKSLALPRVHPQRIIIVGDTGCRLKKAGAAFQSCNDGSKWPWQAIADRAALFKPDLVIHTGDIHYRENACPAGNAACAGSAWGYGFDAFDADFFTPARNLLDAAPWIFVRGNHESCLRAGQGWWRMLDSRPLLAGRDCNDPVDDANGDFSDPYSVQIAEDTQLVVFDSSRTGTKALSESDPIFGIYQRQVEMASAMAKGFANTIFMNHHPILGFAPKPTPTGVSFYPGNAGLQSVMEKSWPKLLFPPNVNALMSGHNHVFQMTSFSTPHPTQFISGNAGTEVIDPVEQVLPKGTTPYAGAEVAEFTMTNQYGFMTMERDGTDWLMREWNRDGVLLTACKLTGSKGKCLPKLIAAGK